MKNKPCHLTFFALMLLAVIPLVYGQDKTPVLHIDKTGSVNPWSHLEINNNPDNFQFAIVTDRTGGHRPGIFEDAVNKLNLLQPEFVMSVGDLIEGYTRDREQIYREWDEFTGFISQLEMPFFYVPGNHDYINDVMAEIWEEKFGRSYYHFVYHDVLFLCLNSEEATKGSNMGGIEKEQYKYIKKVLNENKEVRWTLVFMHQPMWILDNTRYWPQVENLLADRKHTVFAGHHHHYVKYNRNNGKYFMLATTGGGSRLRGPDFGEFDHVVWVTMTDEGPVMANLLLQGIWDEDVVNEDIAEILNVRPFRIEPILSETEFFEKGKQGIKIVNDENVPMHFKLAFKAEKGIELDEVISGVVPPNNVEILNLEIASENPLNAHEINAVDVEAEYSFTVADDREIKMHDFYRFKPLITKPLFKVEKNSDGSQTIISPQSFDYVTGENALATGDVSFFEGSRDLNLQFTASYDDNYLYIDAQVSDDDIVLSDLKSTWDQDGIRFYIDPRLVTKSYQGREENPGKDFLRLYLSPDEENKTKNIIYRPESLPNGVVVKTQVSVTEGVISYELKVPVSWLNEYQPGGWQHVRINVAANDVDSDGSQKFIWWRPEWRSQQNIMGSGIFEKR